MSPARSGNAGLDDYVSKPGPLILFKIGGNAFSHSILILFLWVACPVFSRVHATL